MARLMVASPEFVYQQLKFYGENAHRLAWVGLRCGKQELEAALLTGNNKAIHLVLAQFAFNQDVGKSVDQRANSAHGFQIAGRGVSACLVQSARPER